MHSQEYGQQWEKIKHFGTMRSTSPLALEMPSFRPEKQRFVFGCIDGVRRPSASVCHALVAIAG